ncbi:alpha/beta fold hydrolase, partial [Paenibacillus sp. GYB003]
MAQNAAASGGANVARVVLVGATLRFVGEDRARAWPERVVRRMRAQLAERPAETVRRFAEATLSAEERADRPELPSEWADRLLAPTDFSPAGLDAGLGYLLETDLTERWERFARSGAERTSDGRADRSRPDVFWLHGGSDPICPVGAISHPSIRPETTTIFPGAGHAPFLTERGRFAERLRRIADGHR